MSGARDFSPEFQRWCRGDQTAVDFLNGVFGAVHLWDDLIDGDRQRSEEDINRVFFWLLCELPRHPFFAAHTLYLTSVLQVYVEQWLAATRMERSGNIELQRRAFGLRDSSQALAAHVAYLVGGYDHMQTVSREILATACDETQQEYLEGLPDG